MKKQYVWIILLLIFIFLGSRYLNENLNEEKKDRTINLNNKKTPVFDFEDGVYEYVKHFTDTAEDYSASSTTDIVRDSPNKSTKINKLNTKETRDKSGKSSTSSASANLSDKNTTESIDLDSKVGVDNSDRSNISKIDRDKEEVVKDEDPNSRLHVEAILRESIYRLKMKNFIKPSNESCKRRLPHCMVVGVAKSGTREIMDFMRLHPHIEIWHRDSGYEMEYFGPKEYGRGQEWFRSQMPCSYSNQITIMKNAWYFHSTSIPERIKKLNESIKLILLVREPVARAISQFTFMNNKHHRVLSFDDVAIKNNTVNEKDLSIRLSMYDRSMKTWLKYFELDQFLIIDSNEMKYQPATVMTKVEDFLGLGHYITPEMFVLNKDKGFYCIKSNLTKSGMACYANDRGRSVTQVSQRTRTMLENHYKPINERFSSIIGKSFNW